MHLALTPGQAVTVHGWTRPRPTLRWSDVVERADITFDRLRAANLSLKQLHALQPDVHEWVRYGGVSLKHALDLRDLWGAHPLRDLHADLADVLAMRWRAETLRRLDVTYEDLLAVGMTPETMRMFGFSLLGWINIGFRREHLRQLSDAHIGYLFITTRAAAERCFAEI